MILNSVNGDLSPRVSPIRELAKMSLPLQIWLIERYSKPGDWILDPMAGSGTLLVACSLSRNVILVELEEKFIKMCEENWEKVKMVGHEMGHTMGQAIIKQGDARNLEGILADCIITSQPYPAVSPAHTQEGEELRLKIAKERGVSPDKVSFLDYTKKQIDCIITSPPYAETLQADKDAGKARIRRLRISGHNNIADRIEKADNWHQHEAEYNPDNPDNLSNLPYGNPVDIILTSPPYSESVGKRAGGKMSWGSKDDMPYLTKYSDSNENIGNLPHGDIDVVISSPPYEEAMGKKHHSPRADKLAKEKSNPVTYTDKVDTIITSPPYEGSITNKGDNFAFYGQADSGYYEQNHHRIKVDVVRRGIAKLRQGGVSTGYSEGTDNIGNLKGQTYLNQIFLVYQQCYKILKPNGLMILVVKNFIRNKQEIPLDAHTISLCEQCGFKLIERHYRKLLSQSFWRTIYQQKYPNAPVIDREDILVFRKE